MTVFAPILPTDAQRLASDPESSSWVSANAGSGKTHVLTDRMARLLLKGTPPSRIVCLTFTKAAAAEMARRLFKTLGEWAGMDDAILDAHLTAVTGDQQSAADIKAARRLFAAALETPGGLKIQTIHAFCERLLQRFPVEAGVVPGFQIIDERLQRQLLAAAQQAVFKSTDQDHAAAIRTVARYLTADGFQHLLVELLAHRATIGLYATEAIRRQVLAAALDVAPDDRMERLACKVVGGLDRAGYDEAAQAMRVLGRGQAALFAIDGLLAATSPDAAFGCLRSLFLTQEGEARSERSFPPRSLSAANSAAAAFLAAESMRLAPAFERGRRLGVFEATSALLALAAPILAHYEEAKRAIGRFDYSDLIDKSLALLSDPETAGWVLYKLDGGIDHLLIDEAQDTSREQWQIVQGLTGEFFAGEGTRPGIARSLFVVGDRKQCIFAFQGADPDAFEEMRAYFARRIAALGGNEPELGLTVSFRSTRAILEVVDRVFPGEIHEANRATAPGLVELWPLETREAAAERDFWQAPRAYDYRDHPRRKLARRIAQTIGRWIADEEPLPARGRAIRPGDILILVRQRTTLMDELVRALKIEGLPVSGADRLSLATNIAVMDLLALGHAALMPADDQMLACVLKSPLVERDDGAPVGDDDLLALAAGRGPSTLWRRLEAAVAVRGPYRTALARLEKWRKAAAQESPFEFFSGVLAADRSRARFIARLGGQCGEPLDAFLSQCLEYDSAHSSSLPGFLAWIEAEDTVLKRDMEQGADEIRVMTVHGAKGLEANIVILPDTCDLPDRRKDPAILTMPVTHSGGSLNVPLWRVKSDKDADLITGLRDRVRAREMAEYERLLYVAMTRAKDRLYICGFHQGKADSISPESWYRRVASVLEEIGKCRCDPEGRIIRTHEGFEPGTDENADDAISAAESEPLPPWIHAPPPAEEQERRVLIASHAPAWLQSETILSPLRGGSRSDRARGLHVHRLLEALPRLPPSERDAAARRYLGMPGHGLEVRMINDIVGSVLAVIDHDDFRDCFAPGSLAEVSLAATVTLPDGGEMPVAGRIDRLIVRGNEVLIIDYKTSRPPPRTLEEVDPAYVWQLALYRLALSAIYPGSTVRAAILWTEALKLMEIPVAIMDQALHGGVARTAGDLDPHSRGTYVPP